MAAFTDAEQAVFDQLDAALERMRMLSRKLAEESGSEHPHDVRALRKARALTFADVDQLLAQTNELVERHQRRAQRADMDSEYNRINPAGW